MVLGIHANIEQLSSGPGTLSHPDQQEQQLCCHQVSHGRPCGESYGQSTSTSVLSSSGRYLLSWTVCHLLLSVFPDALETVTRLGLFDFSETQTRQCKNKRWLFAKTIRVCPLPYLKSLEASVSELKFSKIYKK